MSTKFARQTLEDFRLLLLAVKKDDPYATLEALGRISRIATGIILIGIVAEIGWAIRTFTAWDEFWAVIIPDVLIAIGLAIEFRAIGQVIIAEGDVRVISDRDVAEAKKASALAMERAAIADMEAARIKAEASWRRLSEGQFKSLVESLRGLSSEVYISFVEADQEARLFRSDLDAAFSAAGVPTRFFSGYSSAVGLTVCDLPGPALQRIIDALKAANLSFAVENVRNHGFAGPEIIVGSKPPPYWQGGLAAPGGLTPNPLRRG